MNLNQVTVPTIDLEKAIVFYETLGLRLIVKAEPRYARFVCPVGQATFSLHLVDHLPGANGTIVYFELDDLDERVEALKKAGLTFEQDPIDQSWLWREARIKDPDGNLVILYHAGENRKNPPWRLEEKKEQK